ncbi:MAG: YdcF family protein [Solobacterium sp.]|nr:YdcF family protein [Solobacterium sp.]
MFRLFGILIGILGTAMFALPFFAGIFNAGSLAGTFLSLVLLLGCLFEEKLRAGSIRYVCRAVQAGYAVFFCVAAIACFCMYRECRNAPPEEKPQTVVVLGCGLEGDRPSLSLLYRLQRAYAWLMDHPDAHVVVSGGQGGDEIMPEARCMAEWLISHGIEEDRIHQEDRSSTTYENLAFTRTVLKENDLPEEIIIVSNSFHVYRACLIARKQGYACTALSARTTWWLLPSSVLREVLGIALEWIKG